MWNECFCAANQYVAIGHDDEHAVADAVGSDVSYRVVQETVDARAAQPGTPTAYTLPPPRAGTYLVALPVTIRPIKPADG